MWNDVGKTCDYCATHHLGYVLFLAAAHIYIFELYGHTKDHLLLIGFHMKQKKVFLCLVKFPRVWILCNVLPRFLCLRKKQIDCN